jgi:hypothetical protein
MAVTHVLISSVTVGAGGAANISFTSIPGTYTDLLIKLSGRTVSNYGSAFTQTDASLNSTAYATDRVMYGNGGSLSTNSGGVGITYGTSTNAATASTFGNAEIYIPNYTGSLNKVVFADGSAPSDSATTGIIAINATRYAVTSAITTVTITPYSGAGNFDQYSSAQLYGIKNS